MTGPRNQPQENVRVLFDQPTTRSASAETRTDRTSAHLHINHDRTFIWLAC
jgi:hypothetical protein